MNTTHKWQELTGHESADDLARLYVEDKIHLATLMNCLSKLERKKGTNTHD